MESSGTGEAAARAVADTEGERTPFLVFDERGSERTFTLPDTADRLTIGRGGGVDLPLDFDETVSTLHAELERLGRHWVVCDDGLSRNGSFLNGERIHGRCRLRNGDELKLGSTTLTFRQPGLGPRGTVAAPTAASVSDHAAPPKLTERQREIVIALSRPYTSESAYATPATNTQIAEETHLSVDAVKRHLRILFDRFGIGSLPQNEKRVRLVELARQGGHVSPRDFDPPRP